MTMTNREIAEAFSGHRFDDALSHFADAVEWELIGDETVSGRDRVAEWCAGITTELADTTTSFPSFVTIDGGDVVAVDSVSVYADPDGETSTVSSCDIYHFTDGKVTRVRSYTVAVE